MKTLLTILIFWMIPFYLFPAQGNPEMSDSIQRQNPQEPEQNIPLLTENQNQQPENQIGFDGFPKRDYPFLLNFPWVTYAGAATIDSALTLTLRGINYPISLLTVKTGGLLGSFIFLGKTLLIDAPLTITAMTFNHEFFGHAARVREAGGTVKKVHISMPWPYGSGGGYISYSGVNHYDENILVITGGSEANLLLSQGIARRWTRTGIVDQNDYLLYSITRLDLFFYIQTLKSASGSIVSNDIDSYLTIVNNKYGYTQIENFPLTLKKLKNWSYILLIDPYLYMGVISAVHKQITKKNIFHLPLIPLGKNAGFLPSMKIALTPFGPEWYIDIFFKLPEDMTGQYYLRVGTKTFRSFWGMGFRIDGIKIVKNFSIGAGFDIFSQPEIASSYSGNSADTISLKTGFALYLDLTVSPIRDLKLYARIGYKTDGYVFGMALKKSVLWHFGFGIFL